MSNRTVECDKSPISHPSVRFLDRDAYNKHALKSCLHFVDRPTYWKYTLNVGTENKYKTILIANLSVIDFGRVEVQYFFILIDNWMMPSHLGILE